MSSSFYNDATSHSTALRTRPPRRPVFYAIVRITVVRPTQHYLLTVAYQPFCYRTKKHLIVKICKLMAALDGLAGESVYTFQTNGPVADVNVNVFYLKIPHSAGQTPNVGSPGQRKYLDPHISSYSNFWHFQTQ